VKSGEPDQLMARVRALLRRSGEVSASPVLTWGELCLDPSSAQVTYGQTVVPCRPKEYTLLELFLRNPERLLSRSNIIDRLWSFDDAPVEGSVTTLVKDLRRRLKVAGMEQDPIDTVYGLGYRLKPAPLPPAATPSLEPSSSSLGSAIAGQASTLEKADRFRAVMQQVDIKFRASWAQRLAVLEQTEQALRAGTCTREQKDAALASVHKLVGGLGTFGYDQAALPAEMMEAAIIQHLQQETQWANQFTVLLAELQAALSQVPESVPTAALETESA